MSNYIRVVIWLLLAILVVIGLLAISEGITVIQIWNYYVEVFSSTLGVNLYIAKAIAVLFTTIFSAFVINRIIKVLTIGTIMSPKDRTVSLLIIGAYFISFYLLLGFATMNDNFGKAANKCYTVTTSGIVICPCEPKIHREYGTEVKPLTSDIIAIIKGEKAQQIYPDETFTFFDVSGKPLVWYHETDKGKFEFFSRPGFHPQIGIELKPVSAAIVKKYLSILNKKRTAISNQSANNSGAYLDNNNRPETKSSSSIGVSEKKELNQFESNNVATNPKPQEKSNTSLPCESQKTGSVLINNQSSKEIVFYYTNSQYNNPYKVRINAHSEHLLTGLDVGYPILYKVRTTEPARKTVFNFIEAEINSAFKANPCNTTVVPVSL